VGTTSTLTTTAQANSYSIRGKAYTFTGAANQATPTLDATTGVAFLPITAGNGSVFTIGRNAAGDMAAVQGAIEPLDSRQTVSPWAFLEAPQFGALPADFCPYGYVVVKVNTGGASWTFGTSNTAGPPANTFLTYTDVLTLPSRPQVA
jgi:hypothetical protein